MGETKTWRVVKNPARTGRPETVNVVEDYKEDGDTWSAKIALINGRDMDAARLISAAPDLLAALKCFVEDERFQVGVGGNPNVVSAMIEAARAAVAKAEGRSTALPQSITKEAERG